MHPWCNLSLDALLVNCSAVLLHTSDGGKTTPTASRPVISVAIKPQDTRENSPVTLQLLVILFKAACKRRENLSEASIYLSERSNSGLILFF